MGPSDKGLKHNPFSALRNVAAPPAPPAAKKPARPGSALGRVVVREEHDEAEGAVIARVVGVPHDLLSPLGKRWREALGARVMIEGKDLLVVSGAIEQVAELLRDAGADEVVVVRREAPERPSGGGEPGKAGQAGAPGEAGEPGGTTRAKIGRGLRVGIVQKADQESGALTYGVVRDILTSSPEHPRGIKVRLESGEVGRVRRIVGR